MKSFTINSLITKIENESFKKYLRDVSKIKNFENDEEIKCAIKASNGDIKARQELVSRNLKFVISIAKQYVTQKCLLEDLVNEGNIGLIMAAERFNPNQNVKFITYAVWWIRKLIIEHINNNNRMVRLPLNKLTALSKLDKKISDLEQKNSYKVDINELCNELNSDEFECLDVLTSYRMDSLDSEISSNDDNGMTLLDILNNDEYYQKTDYLVDVCNYKQTLNEKLNNLKTRDKEILILLFGLDGKEPRTLKEVGIVYDLSIEMVRQIKNKSILKLSKDKNLKLAYNEI